MKSRYYRMMRVLAIAGLAGCTPTRVGDHVPLAMADHWQNSPADRTATAPGDLRRWWRGFGDPLLNDLVQKALAANPDIRIATARVREAGALVAVAESALYPSLDISAGGGREQRIDRVVGVPGSQGIVLTAPRADAVTAGLTARWEIDIFGGRHLEAEAAAAEALGAEEARRAAQVGLLSQVATHYLQLRGVQRQTAILRENIAVQARRLSVLQALHRAGLATEWDVTRQEGLLRETEASLPRLAKESAGLIHRLGVLLGLPPASLQARLSSPAPLPETAPKIPGLLPSDLLTQRPDVRLARREVSAMAASLGAARAELYPRFLLSASAGFGALAAGGFPSLAETVYTLGAGLSAPLFDGGRIRARIEAADARLVATAADFEKTFLGALEDVENAYVAHASALERRDRLIRAEAAAERSHRQGQAFYQRGAADFLSVLDAQRTRLTAGSARAEAETAVRVSLVSLYRAFGGGWSEASVACARCQSSATGFPAESNSLARPANSVLLRRGNGSDRDVVVHVAPRPRAPFTDRQTGIAR